MTGSFATAEDLQNQVHAAIEHDIVALGLGSPVVPRVGTPHATLRAVLKREQSTHFDSKGRPKNRTRRWLEVTNEGRATALGVRLEMEPLGGDKSPRLHDQETAPDLRPGDSFSYGLSVYLGDGPAVRLAMTWEEEDGESYSDVQTVSLTG